MDTTTFTNSLLNYLLPPLPGVRVQQIGLFATDVLLRLVATAPTARCPTCGTPSSRVHSSYTRHFTDLPWGRARVQVVLRVRKFRCAVPTCPQRVFTERLPTLVAPYARQTARRQALVRSLGFALGGRAAVRLAARLHLPTPRTSLLRLVRQAPRPRHDRLRVIGLDDWAWRRGHHYGTIIVDLERHQPVNLLPDRRPETVIAWLRRHPSIEIVSRDRASAYADAVTRGAPQARQVADRFHLLVNLADAVQRLLDRYPGALQHVTEQAAQQAAQALGAPMPPAAEPSADPGATPPAEAPAPPPVAPPAAPPAPAPPAEPPSRGTARSAARFAAVKALQEQGLGQRAIARRLGLHRHTVRRYMVADQVPVRGAGRQAQSTARGYIPYLRHRWAEGCRNGVQLWEELRQQGYAGSYTSVYRLLRHLFGHGGPWGGRRPTRAATSRASQHPVPSAAEVRPLTARQARWLLLRPVAELSAAAVQQRTWLLAACPAAARAAELAQRFVRMVRERRADELAGWLVDARASGVAELRNFAQGVQRDYSAVRAGLSEIWSQGQVEGQVHRLKFLKRQMYGRAGFALLRARVLHREPSEQELLWELVEASLSSAAPRPAELAAHLTASCQQRRC